MPKTHCSRALLQVVPKTNADEAALRHLASGLNQDLHDLSTTLDWAESGTHTATARCPTYVERSGKCKNDLLLSEAPCTTQQLVATPRRGQGSHFSKHVSQGPYWGKQEPLMLFQTLAKLDHFGVVIGSTVLGRFRAS